VFFQTLTHGVGQWLSWGAKGLGHDLAGVFVWDGGMAGARIAIDTLREAGGQRYFPRDSEHITAAMGAAALAGRGAKWLYVLALGILIGLPVRALSTTIEIKPHGGRAVCSEQCIRTIHHTVHTY
jgi:hypothetical protein